MTHVNELPNEILTHIFSLSDYELDNYSSMLTLACVCRQWHHVIWSCPRFWTSQSFSIGTKLKNDGPHSTLLRRLCDHFDRWYGRAGNVPRDLSLSFEEPCRKTPALYKYFTSGTRWNSLSFTFRYESHWSWLSGLLSSSHKPYWPDLTDLRIIAPANTLRLHCLELPLGHASPNLRYLKIRVSGIEFGMSITSIFSPFPPPFANLTVFDFEGALTSGRYSGSQTLTLCAYLLLNAPNLEVLRVLDGQGLWDNVAAPEQYARSVPLKHEALRELTLHWNKNATTLLARVVLPRLEMLDLTSLWVTYESEQPAPDQIDFPTLSDVLETLFRHSTKAASDMGTSFSLKRLYLGRIMLGAEDRYRVVMLVKDMVEEMTLDCSPCAWHTPTELFKRLDEWANGGVETTSDAGRNTVATRPRVLFPNLKTFTANTNRYSELSFTVSQANQDEYATFKASPLAWWRKCQRVLDEAEAKCDPGDDWTTDGNYSDLDGDNYQDDMVVDFSDDIGWDDEDEEMGEGDEASVEEDLLTFE